MATYCNHCGTELKDTSAPCPTCGTEPGAGAPAGLPLGMSLPGVDLALDPELIVVTHSADRGMVLLFQGENEVAIPLADVERILERIAEQARQLGDGEAGE